MDPRGRGPALLWAAAPDEEIAGARQGLLRVRVELEQVVARPRKLHVRGNALHLVGPVRPVQPLLLAPTTSNEFNTVGLPLPAVACVQLTDILFEFDSSFPLMMKSLSNWG